MANNQVTINTDTNQVEVQQTAPSQIIQVNTPGVQGPPGAPGPTGSEGAPGPQGPAGTLTNNTGASITGSFYVSGSDAVVDFSNASAVTASNILVDGDILTVLGNVFVQGTLDAATKNFKIQHPTMPGYYLVHSSLEGPERGMYVRGKLKTSDTIHLPDYWNELTDDVDITVQLTPIGNSCTHFVKSVNKQEIIVGCDCGTPHCYYIVHAQRYNEGKFNVLQPKKTKSL